MDYGKTVRQARLARGWSQQELAQHSNSTQSTVNRIEAGTTKWSRSLASVMAALGISLSEDGSIIALVPEPSSRVEAALLNSVEGPKYPFFVQIDVSAGGEFPVQGGGAYMSMPGADHAKCYAVVLTAPQMRPEFEPGDVILVDRTAEPTVGRSGVFVRRGDRGDVGIIRRLLEATEDEWLVAMWNDAKGEREEARLKRSDWPECHAIIQRRI